MTNKKITQKEASVLEMKLDEVFVAKSVKNRAYIEQFTHTSVNFTQRHLGTICGFFIIRNESKYNAHIVNVLTSELKKEFFSVSRRTISEAFEAALYKCNKVLTKLATEGNTEWLGSIDGAVCTFDDSTIYFSVTGEASLYLIRERNITNISEGLASEEAREVPMKTFVDTAQGPLYEFDRIIITSKELTDLISLEELKNNSFRFSDQEFNQLISTILKNESNLAATTIINVSKKVIKKSSSTNTSKIKLSNEQELNQQINAFAADTFIKREKKPKNIQSKKEKTVPKKNYVDRRTGHIYIKANKTSQKEKTQFDTILNKTKDISSDLFYVIKIQSSRTSYKLVKLSKKTYKEFKLLMESRIIPNSKKFLKARGKQLLNTAKKIKNQKKFLKNEEKIISEEKNTEKKDNKLKINSKPKKEAKSKKNNQKKIESREKSFSKNAKTMTLPIVKKINKKIKEIAKTVKQKAKSSSIKNVESQKIQYSEFIKNFFVEKNNKKSILFVMVFICFLVSVPFVFDKIYNKKQIVLVNDDTNDLDNKKNSTIENEKKSKNSKNSQKDKNITKIGTKITDISNTKLITSLSNGTILVTTTNSFIKIDKNNKKSEIAIPKEYGKLVFATYMYDLSHVFFITDKNTIYSYSPKVDEFKKQHIKKTLNYKNIKSLNSYLTYIYILENDKIERFARIEGGFDKPVIWHEGTNFSKTTSCSIDGDIYVANNKKINIFSHKNLTNKKLPDNVKVDEVFTNENLNLLWVLDKQNKTIVGYNKKTLTAEKTVKDDILGETKKISINKNTAIVSTNTSIYKIPIK